MVCADAGYAVVEKGKEHAVRHVIWQLAAQYLQKNGKHSAVYKAMRKNEKAKCQVRAKVEHPFRVIKGKFGYTKLRLRGLVKITAHIVTLFAM